MKTILKFFTEDNGNYSIMRLMCFVCLINAVILSYMPGANIEQVGMWLAVAFGSKLVQKPMEKGTPQ